MPILSQGLISVSCSASADLHKKLRGSIAMTADLTWPKGHFILCMNWGDWARKGQGWDGRWSVGGEQL